MTMFDKRRISDNKYQVYFTGYEHPHVKSGYKVVEVAEKTKYAYLRLFNKNIKLPITVWAEMKKGAKKLENE
jgi:hypothetical protein|tara:strand:- start:257 stop:472 length:216 start_codon:yes stop_codon:yes gene_type:complete